MKIGHYKIIFPINNSMDCEFIAELIRNQVCWCNPNLTLIIEGIEESCEDTRACKPCLMQQDMQIYLDCEGLDSVVRRCIRCVHSLLRYPENLRVTRLGAEFDDDVQRLTLVCRHRLTRWKYHGSPCNENKQANRLTFVESGCKPPFLYRDHKSTLRRPYWALFARLLKALYALLTA